MHILERWCIALRHNRWLGEADRLWNWMRPRYDKMMALFGRNGLERTISGYGVFDLDGRQIERVEGYGEIVALTGQTLG